MIRPSTVGAHADARRGPAGAPIPSRRAGAGRIDLRGGGIGGRVQFGPLHLLQRGDIVRPQPQLGHDLFRQLPGLLGAGRIAAAARLHRSAMEQSRRRRHAHQGGHLGAAARLAVDHDLVGIAAEIGDVLAHPAKRRNQVGHADVHRIGIGRPADLGQIEESEDVEAVIDRHRHDIVMPRHLRAFVRGQFVGRAEAETAAVKIDHHRTLAGQRGRPDVQLEHVFAHVAVVPILKERLFDRREVVQALRAVGP